MLSQTLRDIEVICVDDASTDGSSAILADYAKRDARPNSVRSCVKFILRRLFGGKRGFACREIEKAVVEKLPPVATAAMRPLTIS